MFGDEVEEDEEIEEEVNEEDEEESDSEGVIVSRGGLERSSSKARLDGGVRKHKTVQLILPWTDSFATQIVRQTQEPFQDSGNKHEW